MKIKNSLLCIAILIGFANMVEAQGSFKFPDHFSNAYTDYLYEAKEVKVVTETYEKNVPKVSFPVNVNNVKDNVLLDIYYCENNSVNIGLKPLILFSPGGGREKSDYKFIASDLARRGFVIASINVRGNTLNSLQLMFNAKNVNPVLIMTGAMDLHNAIHYILNQRASALSVDPNYVIVAGGSLGGAISLQAAFMDKEEANAKFGKNVNNDFFKNFDPVLQTNNIKGVLDFYGAVYDVNFIKPTETKPVFIFHGSTDPAVPYMEGNLFYNPIDVYVYGGVRIAERIKDHNSYYFITGKDVGHTLTPQCSYNVNSFPNGYPMNWYPDMLFFIKNAILGNQTIKVTKTVDCIEPECSMNKNSCRVVVDDVNNGSRKPGNAVIPKPNFNKSILISAPVVIHTPPVTTVPGQMDKLDHCKALSFDGNDFVKVNNSPSLAVGFDVEFWFKQASVNPDNNVEILYSMGTSNNIRNSAFTFGLLGNNQIYIGYFNGSNYVEKLQYIYDNQSSIYLVDGNWHHYHFKVSNGNLSGEIDGNKGMFSLPNSIKTSVNTDNTVNTYLGGADFNTGSIAYKFNNAFGQLHEIRLWKSGYSFENSNEAISPAASGLVAYWKLNSGSQLVKDEAPYKINGVLGTNISVEQSDPTFVNNCDGTNMVVPKVVSPTQIAENPDEGVTSPKDTIIKITPMAASGIAKVGINLSNTTQKPIVDFYTQASGKAVVTILNSSNKAVLSKTIPFTTGTNSLDAYIQPLKSGNYTLKIALNKKTYTQQFTIPK